MISTTAMTLYSKARTKDQESPSFPVPVLDISSDFVTGLLPFQSKMLILPGIYNVYRTLH